ncbi:MAG: nucleoside-diphosphate sugar epimerase/dehydratase [bacterium]|nr:nucleoside-diphosphate sugar epimerase/dehydratase [bacterium]
MFLLHPTQTKRFIFFLLLDIVIIFFSLYFSFLLRFDFDLPMPYPWLMLLAFPSFLVVKLMSFQYFKLYKLSWRFVSLKDFYNILKAIISSSSALMIGIYFFRFSLFQGFPRGVIIIDAFVTFILVAFLRISKRLFFEVMRGNYFQQGKKTVIVGAGNTGEMILRDIQKGGFNNYFPIAFLDDDKNRVGTYLHGIKVAGGLDDLSKLIQECHAMVVIIAIPSLGHKRLKEIYKQAKETNVEEIKIVPRIYDIHQPQVSSRTLEDIKIEDLVGRQAVKIDYKEIGLAIEGKTVLITGAAGSIGSEIVKQIGIFNPGKVVLFESDETELYKLELFLKECFSQLSGRMHFLIGDVRDFDYLQSVFNKYKPEVVFHAAAYKHVPVMECNVAEAVKTNVIGTHNVALAAFHAAAEKFVMISTDKAVRPTSIMGATKRLAEYICRAFNGEGRTEFISVRFGNVLGSRGSVLPLFLEQIKKGGPVTVTHKEMKRYFMTIPEAVSLVLQASVIGRGGDILVLDMGEPVKIIDLAEELIRLHGFEPYKDVDINFIGLRPGEKLFEEILTAEEGTVSTRHEKIFIAQAMEKHSLPQIEEIVNNYRFAVNLEDEEAKEIRQMLKKHIKWYDGGEESANRLNFPLIILQK